MRADDACIISSLSSIGQSVRLISVRFGVQATEGGPSHDAPSAVKDLRAYFVKGGPYDRKALEGIQTQVFGLP